MSGEGFEVEKPQELVETNLDSIAKWLSCNGEVWGVGPTVVFASAAALFLYHELEATVFIAGDQAHVSLLEKTLVSTMVLGMLALMIHLWVCSMRFFQYYLDTLIRDSPSMLLEMTTAGLLGGQADMVPLGPLTRFLRQQQPQIHITFCWFLSLCYADYVRKHYCQRFNMPYLEQWQAELHERASRGVSQTLQKVNSFVGSVHQRLRGLGQTIPNRQLIETHTVRAQHRRQRIAQSVDYLGDASAEAIRSYLEGTRTSMSDLSANQVKPLLMLLTNCGRISPQPDVLVAVHQSPGSVMLAIPSLKKLPSFEEHPWRSIAELPSLEWSNHKWY